MKITGIVHRGRWTYDAEQDVVTGEVTFQDRSGTPQVADPLVARTFQPAKGQIGYTPAKDRLEAARPGYEDAVGVFYRLHEDTYKAMTKAQLLETDLVWIHESYPKAEMVENALETLWHKEPTYLEFRALQDDAEAEATILKEIEKAREAFNGALHSVRTVAKGYGEEPTFHIQNLRGCVEKLHREELEFLLWARVAFLTGPDKHTPIEALRLVVFEAVNKALDDLEDKTPDLAAARIRARWVRRYGEIVGMKELQG